MKFSFLARCGDQTLPLEVETPFKPGKQVQRARRLAVGELLAVLEIEQATVDASGEDMVRVTTDEICAAVKDDVRLLWRKTDSELRVSIERSIC